jgi:hypothetical protein
VLVVPVQDANAGALPQGVKVRPAWREQQKTLWVEVRKETGRWKSRWKIRDLLADKRCSRAVLDFLSTTDVGRRVPPLAEEEA